MRGKSRGEGSTENSLVERWPLFAVTIIAAATATSALRVLRYISSLTGLRHFIVDGLPHAVSWTKVPSTATYGAVRHTGTGDGGLAAGFRERTPCPVPRTPTPPSHPTISALLQ